ncbi:MAG TPA: pyruvate formate-lyase-activating protein [Bacilli bacterium]|nr:pyruvate formate-lyase-activating protein [Bacilli bacterium]
MVKCNLELKGNIYFIETMGAFDGPGLRYVLFMQGCPLKCKFCHNRDSWSTEQNITMSVNEVLADFKKYQSYYRRGGITVSGGEPTLQIEFVTELFKACKNEGIHTCLDTSAGTFSTRSREKHAELLRYTDLVLLDIKHIDNETHRWLVGISNHQVLDFAKYLDELKVKTIIRHVLLPNINADEANLTKLRQFIDGLNNIVGIDILPYHKAGTIKWDKLGVKYELGDIAEPSKEEIRVAEKTLKENYNYMK